MNSAQKNSNHLPKIILVLGMHRSGTSLVAQIIAKWGAFMGDDLMRADKYNQDGYWEYNPLVNFHEKLLKKTNNKWYAPSEEINTRELLTEFGDEARQLVIKMDLSDQAWCWKDPRMPLFLDFWKQILAGREIIYILVNRPPNEIAASLLIRDKIPASLSLSLWEYTTKNIFQTLTTETNYKFIDYEKLILQPGIYCKELFNYLNNSCHLQKKQEIYERMVLSVRNSLNHAKPGKITISPSQRKLQQIIEKEHIPDDFRMSEYELMFMRDLFSLYGKIAEKKHNLHYAQLFYINENAHYDEIHSLVIEVTEDSQNLFFKFNNSLLINKLRIDPINDFLQVHIISAQFLNQGKILNIPFKFSSNAFSIENSVYLFDTNDPQVYINFDKDTLVEIDEVIINLNYIKIGGDSIDLCLNSKNNIIKRYEEENYIRTLENETIRLQNETLVQKIIILEEEKKVLKRLNDAIQLSFDNIKSENKKYLEELINLSQEKKELTEYNEHLIKSLNIAEEKNQNQQDLLLDLFSSKKTLEEQNQYYTNGNKSLEYLLTENQKSADALAFHLNETRFELENLKAIPGIRYFHKIMNFLKPIIPIESLRGIFKSVRYLRNYYRIKYSDLFDEEYYLNNNSDVKSSGIQAIKHFLLFGGFEGRNPSNKFDSKFYLEHNKDVKAIGMNPLIHYIKFGKQEGRTPVPCIIDNTIDIPKLRLSKLDKKSNIRPFFSDNLIYPTNFTIVVLSRGDEHKLKLTLNTLSQQSYKHWHCFILQHSPNIEFGAIKNNKLINYSIDKFETISSIDPLFAFLEKQNGFVAFLQEGEIIIPDCLWQFYNERDEKTALLYSDHDNINEQNHHFNPWFTFNWSPDLLLSQNYIGGFYAASVDLFLSAYNTELFKQQLSEKILSSPAWRYGILLNLSGKVNITSRIPEVLWSCPQQNDKALENEYFAECKEISSFLENQGLNAGIDNYLDGKVRHVKWALVNEPMVSIIIPTTGNLKYLKICIDSLSDITAYKNFEIIILDNGKGRYPDGIDYAKVKGLKIIEALEDFNWSRLNNIGEKHAKGEFLLFLNDDIEITEPQWLTEMVRQAERENIGVVGSLLLYPTNAIQHAGVFLVDHGGGARHWFYKQEVGKASYHNLDQCVREVSANTGACLMVSRKIFNEIGGFDENLAMVGNDVDFCLRCLEAGYRNLWTPYSKLIHHESVTRKATPIEKDEKAMWLRWGNLFKKGDYYYNPHLTLEKEDCSIKHSSKYYSRDNIYDFFKGRKTNKELVKGSSKIIQQPNFGVNLISYIRAEMGIGEAARGNAKALKAANIPFGVINFEKGNPSKMEDLSFQHREISEVVFDINILHINADHTPFVIQNLGQDFFEKKYTIGFWAWELPEFPEKWKNSFDLVDEIWVPSSFVNKAVSQLSPVPVTTIPHVINVVNMMEVKRISNRAYFNIPDHAFVFLSMFDVHSIVERKNPFGSILAFKNAFKANDSDVLLVIKINNANKMALRKLNDHIGNYKNIRIITKHLTRIETDCLLSSIDCFLSLHRSEGFGLGPAEAMARGKVAMLTNWSGNTEYMASDNCIPISFTLEQIGKDLGPYEKHQYWASPDLDEASAKMKLIASNPDMAKQIGERARKTIFEQFSAEKIGTLMKYRLDNIH